MSVFSDFLGFFRGFRDRLWNGSADPNADNDLVGSPSLFTDRRDFVDFNALTDAQKHAVAGGSPLYQASDGNDRVVHPDIANFNGSVGGSSTLGWNSGQTFNGGDGSDRILGGDGADHIDGGAGNDLVAGAGGNDVLAGGAGNDVIWGDAPAFGSHQTWHHWWDSRGYWDHWWRHLEHGSNHHGLSEQSLLDQQSDAAAPVGNDTLSGGGGKDWLIGGGGDDRLQGDAGNDVLAGGDGTDTFAFRAPADGIDRILDFTSATDILEVSASGFGGGLVAGLQPPLLTVADIAVATHAGTSGYFIFVNAGTDKGTVYWDPTGGSANDAIAFAKLRDTPTLAASDIHVA